MKIALIALALVGVALAAQTTVSSSLLRSLQDKQTANILISFKRTNLEAARAPVRARTFVNKANKRAALRSGLESHLNEVSGNVFAFLQKAKSAEQQVEKFWITGQIFVKNADLALVQKLEQMSEIAEIRETILVQGPQPLNIQPFDGTPRIGEQWGVIQMHAPQAWAQGITGKGVTVGIIDTGARRNHVALRDGYRVSRGWYEPENTTSTSPHDVVGHGTHVTGTIAGLHNGVGVAPEATWIHCLGCRQQGCTEEALVGCGQWMVCPKDVNASPPDENPNCDGAPDLVSNSWGGGNEDPFYDAVIQTWRDADIVPVFAIGNAGPYCATANSPGDSVLALAVGSVNNQSHVSTFSSLGPTAVTGRIKPDVAAPGTNIVSSYYLSDSSYYTMSGTSMATPHVAGFVALLLQKDPTLTVERILTLLKETAQPHVPVTVQNCGGISNRVYPNNHVGAGVLNAEITLGRIDAMLAARKQ